MAAISWGHRRPHSTEALAEHGNTPVRKGIVERDGHRCRIASLNAEVRRGNPALLDAEGLTVHWPNMNAFGVIYAKNDGQAPFRSDGRLLVMSPSWVREHFACGQIGGRGLVPKEQAHRQRDAPFAAGGRTDVSTVAGFRRERFDDRIW